MTSPVLCNHVEGADPAAGRSVMDEVVGEVYLHDTAERPTFTVEMVAIIAVIAGARAGNLPVLLAAASTGEPSIPGSTTPFLGDAPRERAGPGADQDELRHRRLLPALAGELGHRARPDPHQHQPGLLPAPSAALVLAREPDRPQQHVRRRDRGGKPLAALPRDEGDRSQREHRQPVPRVEHRQQRRRVLAPLGRRGHVHPAAAPRRPVLGRNLDPRPLLARHLSDDQGFTAS